MNKPAIKKFAVESRQKLIKSTIERLEELGVTDKDVVEVVELGGVYSVKSQTLTEIEKKHRDVILSKINEKGYESFVEEISYTWFNRIIAIRYMEVNDYLPFRTRVLSSEILGKVDPDLITEIADHIDELELNRDKVITLKETHQQEELFKYVFIKVCNYLGEFLPVMFEKIADYTELLLPNVMITKGSVIQDMIELVPEEDWTNQVEIIGWLYQYYISEKKDQVFADLKKNKKITKENIPAATQLFTPEWIVKYMVENSLGRLWLEGHPNKELQSKWKYYLEEAEQEESVQIELNKIKKESEILTPEDLTIIDPAMGSGHILVYAFDVLYQIYQSEGYSEKEIPRLILEKNIHGLDIDDRAGQLAYFALMMKGRKYNRRFLRDAKLKPVKFNVYAMKESNNIKMRDIEYFFGDYSVQKDLLYLLEIFNDAKEYGSMIRVKNLDFTNLYSEITKELLPMNIFDNQHLDQLINNLSILIKQAEILSKRYTVAITNPPYLSIRSGMSTQVSKYLSTFYKESKNDLFTVFMDVCNQLTLNFGIISLINQHSWMFLSGFSKFRERLYNEQCIQNMIHIGAGAFEGVSGEVVQSVAFSIRKMTSKKYKALYIKMINGDWKQHVEGIILKDNFYEVSICDLNEIPNKILCYWLGKKAIKKYYEGERLDKFADPRVGLATGLNDKFLRLWHEIDYPKIGFGFESGNQTLFTDFKWYPYNKGGECRRWYGNREYVVNWFMDGRDITEYKQKRLLNGEIEKKNSECWNREYYFKESISWSKVSSGRFAVRYYEPGFIFDVAGCSILGLDNNINYFMAALNSELRNLYIESLSPTLNFETGAIKAFPIIVDEKKKNVIEQLTRQCIEIEKEEWDSYETSWDFKKHSLLCVCNENGLIKYSYDICLKNNNELFYNLKSKEESINNIFNQIYDLEDILDSQINIQDITFRLVNRVNIIKSFISYAVGCMMGRYSLDEDGLIFAGGEFDMSKYQTFKSDEDGIILISDTEYFEDDLLNKFVEFVKVVYGKETLDENLNFIADTECFKRKPTESSRECLRRYFLKGFMEDHLKVYQKRPIYWMFDSGKQNGFKALIYMHRYNENMVAKVRTDYLYPLQRKYEAELERLDHLINFENISTVEKGKAKKRQEQIYKQIDECKEYDLLLAHVAHQRIPLDLDDGVKVNYQKFQNIELTSDSSSKGKKGDLLYKVKM